MMKDDVKTKQKLQLHCCFFFLSFFLILLPSLFRMTAKFCQYTVKGFWMNKYD